MTTERRPKLALVVTVVHIPLDARIYFRQIRALQSAGWRVEYAAPWTDYNIDPPDDLTAIDVPRATGRSRARALRAARRVLRERADSAGIVLLHDPELLLVADAANPTPVVWDVHEDTAAALPDKLWMPGWAGPAASRAVRALERRAERRHNVMLAERRYQERFRRTHPVVLNTVTVAGPAPTPDEPRVVYLGRVSKGRGAEMMIELGRRLKGSIRMELMGPADDDVTAALEEAVAADDLTWTGFVPNDQALARVAGAAAGLALLSDEPNYRSSLPTKMIEYFANGVPAIATPLPESRGLLERSGGGVVVGFGDVDAAERAIRDLWASPVRRRALGQAGLDYAQTHLNWSAHQVDFLAKINEWSAG